MQRHPNRLLGTLAVSVISCFCCCTILVSQELPGSGNKTDKTASSTAEQMTRFLVVGKGKVADPPELQKREADAVERIANAARKIQSGITIDALAENVMTIQQFRRGTVRELVTGDIFRDRLQRLVDTAKPQDTVVIYTHSHGCRNGFETLQPLGGIVVDLPIKQLPHGGVMLWDEYADLLLQIRAKNVVVLTMACFSGGFVEVLNSKEFQDRWKDRRIKEGRNFIVLTSQNDSSDSQGH